ncbi:MAG: polysaccharide biosynthesis/export family protein [Candidatus Omnitrophica bacterium]|nr:polysaccharide biosynthesis/export family protein [Candidatus Omnitrophota bacterium]
MDGRLSITEVAKFIGVTPRTIMRWEKAGKIKHSKRDWRGWRFYHKDDLEEIRKFYESSYEYIENGGNKPMLDLTKTTLVILIALAISFALPIIYGAAAYAEPDVAKSEAVIETKSTVDINLANLPVVSAPPVTVAEASKYTLGPDDVIEIEVRRHPEFSGQYTVNSEGKIEYKFVGDTYVTGLTKAELQEKLTQILSEYIIEPEVNVRILAYLSKVFYVVGEVNRPGKFYMKGNTVTVREALVQASLPTQGAAMRRCRLITPNASGKNNYTDVNVYKLLYEGGLTSNLDMKPGDVLYVPSTVIAKIIHVISPVTSIARDAAGTAATGAAVAAAAL